MRSDALARLVGDTSTFLREDWEREVRLQHDVDGTSLLDLDDVDGLIAGAALRAPAFRLVKAGDPVPPSSYLRTARVGSRTIRDLIDPGRVQALFTDGATVVLQGLHRYWPPLTAFCRDLESTLSHPVQANAYLTPPVASGLRVHHDAHDVFALQTHGTKHWVAYPMGADLSSLPEPSLDTTLEVGDCLYVPRGVPHAARTVDTASLHITLGVRVTTWRQAVQRAVDQVLAGEAFGESLPPGYADDPALLADALRQRLKDAAAQLAGIDPQPVAERLSDTFVRGRQPSLDGQLRELLDADTIDDETEVRRRPGTLARVRASGDGVQLILGDRILDMPAHAADAVRWVLAHDTFSVADLETFLDAAGRRVLVRRLVREGLLVRRG